MPCLALVALKDFHSLHNLQWTVSYSIVIVLGNVVLYTCTVVGGWYKTVYQPWPHSLCVLR